MKWPGLPRGVKFDPSDEELMWHLLAEIGEAEPHPFIGEFITFLNEDDGFSYSSPHKLPGVKQDGSLSYFFHRSLKAYANRNRKRRKIKDNDSGTTRWQEIGKTKPVYVDGIHKGSKKIMILFMSTADGEKPEKTNWMMHRYHVGTGKDVVGELVLSKIFYQLKFTQGDSNADGLCIDAPEAAGMKVEPVVAPKLIRFEPRAQNSDTISMEVPSQDSLIDNYERADDRSSGKKYCNMANEGEASQYILNSTCSMLDAQAYTGSLCLKPVPKVICETSGQTSDALHTSNMLDHSIISVPHVKVEPSNCMHEQVCIEVTGNISPAAVGMPEQSCESERDEMDHVMLQERYKSMLSSMNHALGCHLKGECGQEILQRATGLASHNKLQGKDSEIVSRKGKHEAPVGHLESIDNISAAQDSSLRPNINIVEECFSRRIEDEIKSSNAQYLQEECHLHTARHHDAKSIANPLMASSDCAASGSQFAVDQSLPSRMLEANCSDENEESGNLLMCQASAAEVILAIISREPGHLNDMDIATCSSMTTPCHPEGTSPNDPLSARCKSQQSQAESYRYLVEACISVARPLNSVQEVLDHNDKNHPSITVPLVSPHEVNAEPLEEISTKCITQNNAEELSSPLPEIDVNSNKNHSTSVLSSFSIRPKHEPVDSYLLGPSEGPPSVLPDISIIKREHVNEQMMDFIDHIPLRERMQILTSTSVTKLSCDKIADNVPQTLPPPEYGSSDAVNAKTKPFSLRRKWKKTATDSVETALEEDAPGLLQVLLDKGITAEEIKLYGDVENDAALPSCSSEDSFEELETVITKLFSDGPSIFKFPMVRQIKGSKAVYCLACLISLIEQARYLHFRQSPVEWGWCRDLQSFIFVFERHNRIVLERPEYGYATYFFELVESLPVDWQIKRLVTTMKLPCCSRTILLENRPLLVGLRFRPVDLMRRLEAQGRRLDRLRSERRVGIRPPRLALVVGNMNKDSQSLMLLTVVKGLRELGYVFTVHTLEDGEADSSWKHVGCQVSVLSSDSSSTVDWSNYEGIILSSLEAKRVITSFMEQPFDSIPVVWLIQEDILGRHLPSYESSGWNDLVTMWRSDFSRANVVVFPDFSLPMIYNSLDIGNFYVIPGSPVNIWEAESYSTSHSRSQLRKDDGFDDDDLIMLLIGSSFFYDELPNEYKAIMNALIPEIKKSTRIEGLGGTFKFIFLRGDSTLVHEPSFQALISHMGLPSGSVRYYSASSDVNRVLLMADLVLYGSFLEEQTFPPLLLRAMSFEFFSVSFFPLSQFYTRG